MVDNEKSIRKFLLKTDSLGEPKELDRDLIKTATQECSMETINKLVIKPSIENKDILCKLAEMADNLDKEGKHEAADLIDNAIKVIAWSTK